MDDYERPTVATYGSVEAITEEAIEDPYGEMS